MSQWARWRHALATSTRVEWERGDVASGFYKRDAGRGASKPIEAIAIFRDDDGKLQCIRDVYGDGSGMDADQIEELFASCCAYPISEEVYRAVTERGEPWLPEYATRLTMKDQAAGVAWTPAYGRKRLGSDVVRAEGTISSAPSDEVVKISTSPESPPAGMGHNHPPEELTPDAKLRAEFRQHSITVKAWLTDIGGQPRNKSEADRLADFATTFGQLSKSATDQHKVEKAPILQQGKTIDAKWFGIRDDATMARGQCLGIAQKWMDAENARLAEEARMANEAAARSAEKSAKQFDAPVTAPPPVQPEKITNIGNMRTVATRERPVWIVTDPKVWAAHLLGEAEIAPDLIDVLGKIARRRGEAGVVDMPGVTRDVKRSAA